MPSTDAVLRENEALKRRVEELLDEQHVLTEQSTQLLEKLAKEKTRVEALERELKRAFARFTGGVTARCIKSTVVRPSWST